MAEIRLTADGERALRESEKLCYATNVAIQAPEHLLAAALIVLAENGAVGLPSLESLEAGVLGIHGRGGETLNTQVMWGSAVREALNMTAASVASAGGTEIDARIIALGLIESGEVNPMFYACAGTSREALRNTLTSG
jgi:hypothetical protein